MDPIVSRQEIARQAAIAADQAERGQPVVNPYPDGSEAFEFWRISFYREQMSLNGESSA